MKRLFDLSLAVLLLVPASLIVAVAAIAVALDSPGPAFFRQIRVGRQRKPFALIKLRTMTHGTRTAASHEISDTAVTRVGSFLRKWKIDELPQIWSVLVGDMSFVGPRPCLPTQELLIAERDRRGVFAMRPGITGPAQLAKVDMSTPVRLAEIDSTYAAQRTFGADLAILAATVAGRGRGDAVTPAQRRARR